jgi:FixJ family two-component response regulator
MPMPTNAETDRPLILVVDDDEEIREALQNLFDSVGLDAVCFASTRELLEEELPERPGCLVLDVRMPGSSGLDLQQRLASRGDLKPIIFLTGHGDIQMTVQAMKAGAVDFLTKPVRDQTLLDAVAAATRRDVAQRAEARLVKRYVERFALLTPRERQVLREVAGGRLNKQIAFALGISVVTVKLHRGNVMRKMQAVSVGELVRIWESLPAALRERRPPGPRPPGPRYDSALTSNETHGSGSHSGVLGEGHSIGQSAAGSDCR